MASAVRRILREPQWRSIWREDDKARIGAEELDPAIYQPHVSNDGGPHRAERVRQRWALEPSPNSPVSAAPPSRATRFEDDRPKPRAREVIGCREPVVAAADHDG